ncbi:ATP-binding cassette domain-containing protein [Chthonobacter albigriseus]|uniref:ATP-binding cassette domain-containing protein n=1 Tax=Chthonobacter albigriseus TaxID=1683161 RepID=UPI0015EECDDA|nr:ATP-binding cassette domain-containing protein [Chthonobacter albigriseus]
MTAAPLVETRGLGKTFTSGGWWGGAREEKVAVEGVDIAIPAGGTLGCVGESGSGKSTLGRMLIRLIEPTAGSIHFDGRDITAIGGEDLRATRRHMQMVFQDPLLSLNPRRTIGANIARPLANFGIRGQESRDRVERLMRLCGLDPSQATRYPNEISGGQCQRVAIARALALEPKFLFLDEPVSALDVSVQAQILNLLLDIQAELGLTYLFVTHDLKLIEFMADEVVVMRHGRVVERGTAEAVWNDPQHPYTRNLLDGVLRLDAPPDWDALTRRLEGVDTGAA